MKKTVQFVGKFTGVLSGIGACASWSIAMWTPTPPVPLSGMAFFVAMLMAILAIIAAIAAYHGHGIVLMVVFFTSFFPIGVFLLGVPGWMRVIGVLNLGYLIAGLVAWRIPQSDEMSESSGN